MRAGDSHWRPLLRAVRTHHRLRDWFLVLAWSPAIAVALMMAVGFPYAGAAASGLTPVLGVLFDASTAMFFASPLLCLIGLVGVRGRSRRGEALGVELLQRAVDEWPPPWPVDRLGGYRVLERRRDGAAILRSAPVAAPLRWIVNSGLVGAAASLILTVPAKGFSTLALVLALMTAVAAAVNQWTVIYLETGAGALRARVERGFGPVGLLAWWRRRVACEAPLLVMSWWRGGWIVSDEPSRAGGMMVPLDRLSAGALGVWESWVIAGMLARDLECTIASPPKFPLDDANPH